MIKINGVAVSPVCTKCLKGSFCGATGEGSEVVVKYTCGHEASAKQSIGELLREGETNKPKGEAGE